MARRVLAIATAALVLPGCGSMMRTATKASARTAGFAAKTATRAAWGVAKTGGRLATAPLRDRGDSSSTDNGGYSYTVRGRRYYVMPQDRVRAYSESGIASYYGRESGPKTASGERYSPRAMTAAHRTLPIGTKVRVHNLENGRKAVFRINDRGPFIRGRVIDLTPAGADRLGFRRQGLARVRVEALR